MSALLCIFLLTSWTWVWIQPHLISIMLACILTLITINLWGKVIAYLGGLWLGLTLVVNIYPLLPGNADTITIIEARQTYVIARLGNQRYFMRQERSWLLEQGDRFKQPQFTLTPIRSSFYESETNFEDRMARLGIHQQLQLQSDGIYVRSWWRPLAIQQRLLPKDEMLKPLVAHGLWHQLPTGYDVGYDVLSLLTISGFGLSLTLRFYDRLLKPFLKTKNRHGLIIIFVNTYASIMMHHFGIIRVAYLFTIRHLFHPSSRLRLEMIGWLMYFVFNPFIIYQLSFHLYVAFRIYFQVIYPSIAKQTWFNKVGAWMILILLIQMWFFQEINVMRFILMPLMIAIYPLLMTGYLLAFLLPQTAKWLTVSYGLIMQLATSIQSTLPTLFTRPIPIVSILVLAGLWVGIRLWLIFQPIKQARALSFIFLTAWLLHLYPWSVYVQGPIIHFINVGQGDATLIQSSKHHVLIDTGGVFQKDIAKEVLLPYFHRWGVYRLHHVIITHDDFDHNGALPSLQQLIRIDQLSTTLQHRLTYKDFSVENMHHTHQSKLTSNDQSLVLHIKMRYCHGLIMGDATILVEQELIGIPHIQALDFLRIGHHGSLTSTSEDWLDYTSPSLAIISVGRHNRYHHPHPQVMLRLEQRDIPIYRTDLHGTIRYQSCKIRS